MKILLISIVYLITGFLQEAITTSYHRCVIMKFNFLASTLSFILTIVHLLVGVTIINSIIICESWPLTITYITAFALGKAVGAWSSLNAWSKREAFYLSLDKNKHSQ